MVIHILISLILFSSHFGQHRIQPPVHRPCQTCVWVMQ
jgi:hypothetical protein